MSLKSKQLLLVTPSEEKEEMTYGVYVLQVVAQLGMVHIGPLHQAGSDGLLTSGTFMKLLL
jgi:hypothetical protein